MVTSVYVQYVHAYVHVYVCMFAWYSINNNCWLKRNIVVLKLKTEHYQHLHAQVHICQCK